MRNHIRPAFENRKVGSIKPSDIQAFVKELSTKLAPSTVEVIYTHTASIFLSAVEDRVLAQTPCRGIKLPRKERKLIHPLESEMVFSLADAVPERYKALVVCTAGRGSARGRHSASLCRMFTSSS